MSNPDFIDESCQLGNGVNGKQVELIENDDKSAALRLKKPLSEFCIEFPRKFLYSEDEDSEDDNRVQPEQAKKSICSINNIPADLTKEVKSFVESWFEGFEDSEIDDQVWTERAVKKKATFFVHVHGYFKENQKAGYAVMIRDVFNRPIIAYSKYHKYQHSAFYHELKGVNKGLELAIEQKVAFVSMRCSSRTVAIFVQSFWMKASRDCKCGGDCVGVCLKCLKWHYYCCRSESGVDDDKTYLVLLDTISLLQTFHRRKGAVFIINAVESKYKAAAYVAEHGNGKGKMKIGKILEDGKLLSLLLEDAKIELTWPTATPTLL